MMGITDIFTLTCLQGEMEMSIEQYLDKELESPLYDATLAGTLEVVPSFIDNNFLELLKANLLMRHNRYIFRRDVVKGYGLDTRSIAKKCTYFYAMNAYEFNVMYNSTQFEYNPIENYDRISDITETHSGNDKDTFNKGSQNDRVEVGNRQDSDTYGGRSTTNTHEVSPAETNDYRSESRDQIQENMRTDNHTTGAQNIQNIYGNREDTNKTEYGHVITTQDRTHGNIGVTTTQQMLQQEREIANLSMVEYVAERLVYYLCRGVL